ncbi:MAG: hypothetical protein WD512_04775 [Candidatus Paceibacterota bacterium]
MISPDTIINSEISADSVVAVVNPDIVECSKCNQGLKINMFSKKGLINKTCNKCHQMSEQKLVSDLKNCMFSYTSSDLTDRSRGKDGRTPRFSSSSVIGSSSNSSNGNNYGRNYGRNNGHNSSHGSKGSNRNSNINLKHESEIILKDSSKFVAGELPIRNELKNVATGMIRHTLTDRGLMVLDLHKTADLFLKDRDALAKLTELRENFSLVVILSFVGKTDGPSSTRYQARGDIQYLISIGVADFGLLVFQRGPAKGWMCDTLSQVFSKGIYFSDDSDDHLESVRGTVSKLLSIHQSDPAKPSNLFNWIQNCSQ